MESLQITSKPAIITGITGVQKDLIISPGLPKAYRNETQKRSKSIKPPENKTLTSFKSMKQFPNMKQPYLKRDKKN